MEQNEQHDHMNDQPTLDGGALSRPNFQSRDYAPLKVKHISHDDLDGHAPPLVAADFFWSYHPETEMDIEHISDYDKVTERIRAFTESEDAKEYYFFFITDIPLKSEAVEAIERFIEESNTVVRFVDHHKSALWLNEHDWAQVTVAKDNVQESASTLFHDYLMTVILPMLEARAEEAGNLWTYMNKERTRRFAELVRSYDTWTWVKEEDAFGEQARQMNDLLYLIGSNAFVHRTLREDFSVVFDKTETLILTIEAKKRDEYIQSKVNTAQLEVLDDNDYFVFVEADSYRNEVSDGLMKHFQEKGVSPQFILVRKEGRLSFRTRGSGYDLTRLAKYFYGGGHAAAAGGRVENSFSTSNARLCDKVRYYHKQMLQEESE